MMKTRRSFFTLASSSVLALALGAGPAFANSWGSHGSSGGSWGSHGSSGGSWGSHGSFGGSHGSIGGFFRHHGSHGSSGGSWGSHGSSGGSWGSHGSSGGYYAASYGSSGGSWGSYGSSGGSWGSYGSGGGYYAASYTAVPVATAHTAVAYLNVKVPEDAKVYLQDQLTTIPGTQRRFVTPAIQQGFESFYTVKVEVVRNGQTITKTAQATVAAGQEVDVVVSFDGQNPKEVVTSVTQTPAAKSKT